MEEIDEEAEALPELAVPAPRVRASRNRLSVMQADAMRSTRLALEQRLERKDDAAVQQVQAAKLQLQSAREEVTYLESEAMCVEKLREELAARSDELQRLQASSRGLLQEQNLDESIAWRFADSSSKAEVEALQEELAREKEQHRKSEQLQGEEMSTLEQRAKGMASQELRYGAVQEEELNSKAEVEALQEELAREKEQHRKSEQLQGEEMSSLEQRAKGMASQELRFGAVQEEELNSKAEVEALQEELAREKEQHRKSEQLQGEEMSTLEQRAKGEGDRAAELELRAELARENCVREQSLQSELLVERHRSSSLQRAEQECREIFEKLEARLEERGTEKADLETELRRAVAAHRFVVRSLISEPLEPQRAERVALAAPQQTVRLSSPPSGRVCEDFLFVAPARMSGSAVAWLRGEEEDSS